MGGAMFPSGNNVQVPEANHYNQNYVTASVNWLVTGSKHQQPSRLSAAQKNPNSFPTDTDAADAMVTADRRDWGLPKVDTVSSGRRVYVCMCV